MGKTLFLGQLVNRLLYTMRNRKVFLGCTKAVRVNVCELS